MAVFSSNDPDAEEKMRQFCDASMVDQFVRQAIQTCWMCLPPNKKTVEEVAKQMQRLMKRALEDLREGRKAFQLEQGPRRSRPRRARNDHR